MYTHFSFKIPSHLPWTYRVKRVIYNLCANTLHGFIID